MVSIEIHHLLLPPHLALTAKSPPNFTFGAHRPTRNKRPACSWRYDELLGRGAHGSIALRAISIRVHAFPFYLGSICMWNQIGTPFFLGCRFDRVGYKVFYLLTENVATFLLLDRLAAISSVVFVNQFFTF